MVRRVVLAGLALAALMAALACGGLSTTATTDTADGGGTACATPAPGCSCIPAYWTEQACYSGPRGTLEKGKCRQGRMTCSEDGVLSACVGEVLPSAESCNGVDDDCNGVIDDVAALDGGSMPLELEAGPVPASVLSAPYQCSTGKPGLCAYGHFSCGDAGMACVANAGVDGEPETCNGIDDDCNGLVDDGLDNMGRCLLPDPSLKGECRFGTFRCAGGRPTCVATYKPIPEVCNNLDDNCDGTVDENPTKLCSSGLSCTGGSCN